MTQHTPLLVCDLDGTLFDTQRAVVVSYGEAGVQADRVLEHWGEPWQTWCSIEEHSGKVRRYRSACENPDATPALPPLTVLRDWQREGGATAVFTGASLEAASTLLKREGVHHEHPWNLDHFRWSRTPDEKRADIQSMIDKGYRVVYVDDDDRAASWMPLDASLILYCGQTVEQLKEDIEWTLSFSPLVRT